MKSRVTLHPVFILHTRPFRDTSLLIDALSMDHGRISLLARGVRTAKTKLRGILQPFVPLLMSWSGSAELVSMSKVEALGLPYHLKAKALISGFYLNELIMRLLPRYDPYPQLYVAYQQALIGLHNDQSAEPVLRLFEKSLLSELGYGLQSNIIPNAWYQFIPGRGLIQCSASLSEPIFLGKNLLALLAEVFDDAEVLRDAKRLMRLALQSLLGGRILKTRELFV